MTDKAQQEAERLIERFRPHAHTDWHEVYGYDKKQGNENARQCAIICVEEILKTSASEYAPEGDHWQSVLNILKQK